MTFLAQTVGMIAFLFLVSSYQVNDRRFILLMILLAQGLFSLHFGLLGAWTAMSMNALGMVRTGLFRAKDDSYWTSWEGWPIVFIALFAGAALLSWEGLRSLLPLAAMIFATYAFWKDEEREIRILILLARPFWFTYNVIVGSYAGIITEVFMTSSILISIWRFDR